MSRRQPPPADSVLSLATLIELAIPLRDPIRMNYHNSSKGYVAVRLMANSFGKDWFVDFYTGPWFYISVGGMEPVCVDNLYSMITTLCALLRGTHEIQI
jgi:hypothetical protein